MQITNDEVLFLHTFTHSVRKLLSSKAWNIISNLNSKPKLYT